MKITASRRFDSISLNKLPGDLVSLITMVGFAPIPNTLGAYAVLDDTGKDVIVYDDNSGEFYRIKNGALNDNGQTVCKYINDVDGWELLLEEIPSIDIEYDLPSLGEVLGFE